MGGHRINYVFDVDCVLTDPRTCMDPEFEVYFRRWMQGRLVYIVSGSSHEIIVKQLRDILDLVEGFFACQGNTLYRHGKLVYDMVWHCEDLIKVLEKFIQESPYPNRLGNHIDIRSGMINFSTIGKGTKEQRWHYAEWDSHEHERRRIVDYINKHFPEVCATIGGQVSIDIAPHGCDKSQIRNKIKGPIYFFGDQTQEGGNDWLLVDALYEHDRHFTVRGWKETWEKLKELEDGESGSC